MTRAFKTFLVWLLMAVLPLHAVAAGIGMSCMSQHQAAGVEAKAHHGAEEAHAHHGQHEAADGTDDGAGADAQPDPHAHSSCSACSVFCVGAVAPPSAYSALPPFQGSEAVIVAPAAFAAGFIPDGPQRPPRRHSA